METDGESRHERMLDKDARPDQASVDEWLGAEAASLWHRLVTYIEQSTWASSPPTTGFRRPRVDPDAA